MDASTWTPGNHKQTYIISAVGSALVLDGSKTMMLLPQLVPAGATVTVKFTNEGEARDPFSISGQNWLPGKKITYVIHRSEVYILYGSFAEDVVWDEEGEWEFIPETVLTVPAGSVGRSKWPPGPAGCFPAAGPAAAAPVLRRVWGPGSLR